MEGKKTEISTQHNGYVWYKNKGYNSLHSQRKDSTSIAKSDATLSKQTQETKKLKNNFTKRTFKKLRFICNEDTTEFKIFMVFIFLYSTAKN